MKVVLADPPANESSYDNSYPNIGILYVLAFARSKHPDLQIRYLESQFTLRQHIEYLECERPDIYGISFSSKTLRLARDTIAAVRRAFPELLILCGGSHATAMPEQVLAETFADAVVIGEGEESFSDVVQARRVGRDLRTVPGLAVRTVEGAIRTATRPLIADLDSVPIPAWDLIDHRRYTGMHLKKQPVESSLVVSRGCPFDCTFCSNPVWKQSTPWLRYRSHDNVIAEIDLLYSRGVREIYLASDEMNFSLRWAKELLDRIIAMGRSDLYFQCNLRVDKIDDSLAQRLREARFWLVHAGMESANQRVLDGLKKQITVQQILNASKILSRNKIRVFGFMMLYNAWEDDGRFCYETTDEVDNSLRFCGELLKNRNIHYMSWQFCTPMPGSQLYNVAVRHGVLRGDGPDVWARFDEHYIALRLPGISEREMQSRIRRGIILKDWHMLRSGNISIRHVWRVKENLAAIFRRP